MQKVFQVMRSIKLIKVSLTIADFWESEILYVFGLSADS
jgi:hypothetical protein